MGEKKSLKNRLFKLKKEQTTITNGKNSRGFINRILNGIEWLGNKLPKPFFMFLYLIIILIIISAILSWAVPNGVTFKDVLIDNPNEKGHKILGEKTIFFFNLLGKDGIAWWFTNFINNFMGLATVGIVLITVIFVTVAEKSGFIQVSLNKIATSLPKKILTPAVIFLGCVSSLAADAGYLILIPLAGTLYYSMGRHPLTGIAAVFAGVSGGFATSLVPGNVEFLMTSLTNSFLDENSPNLLTPLSTYFFTTVLLVAYTFVGWFLTEKVVDKRLMARYPINRPDNFKVQEKFKLDRKQRHGMWGVAGFTIFYLTLVTLLTVIPGGPFNGLINAVSKEAASKAGLLPGNYSLLSHLVLIIGILFLGIGIIYGIIAKTFKTKDDIVAALVSGFKATGPSLILFLVMSQFIAAFSKSQIDQVLGLGIGSGLHVFHPILTLFLFILIVAFLNLFIGSLSAKWGLIGPICVIALQKIGIHPAAAVAAYRVGDSATNLISPLMPYFPLIILYCQHWLKTEDKEKFEIGSLMSIMLPFSMSFLLTGTVIFIIWIAIGIPLGVDGPVYIPVSQLATSVASLNPCLGYQQINLNYRYCYA